MSPVSNGDFRLNIFGGSKWKQGNQWVEWSFEVPADGWYQLTFKVLRSYNDGRSSYRQIAIDGEVPCDALLAYEFPHRTPTGSTWSANSRSCNAARAPAQRASSTFLRRYSSRWSG